MGKWWFIRILASFRIESICSMQSIARSTHGQSGCSEFGAKACLLLTFYSPAGHGTMRARSVRGHRGDSWPTRSCGERDESVLAAFHLPGSDTAPLLTMRSPARWCCSCHPVSHRSARSTPRASESSQKCAASKRNQPQYAGYAHHRVPGLPKTSRYLTPLRD